MTKRINAHEKFRWNGWEFRQSLATSQEVHWEMRHGKLRVRVIYRDIQDSCCWCGHELTEHASDRCVPQPKAGEPQAAACACDGTHPRLGGRGFAPEIAPEWTAIIHFQGLEEGRGVSTQHTGGTGVGPSLGEALTSAEADFQAKLVHAVRLSGELRRGKPPDP